MLFHTVSLVITLMRKEKSMFWPGPLWEIFFGYPLSSRSPKQCVLIGMSTSPQMNDCEVCVSVPSLAWGLLSTCGSCLVS